MEQQRERDESRPSASEQPHLGALRADHIPEDVLAAQDADERIVIPDEDDLLAGLSGVADESLVELDAARRAAPSSGLEPTEEEVLDIGDENYERP